MMRLTAVLACLAASAAAQKRCPAKTSPITPGRPAGTDYAGPNLSVAVVSSRDVRCLPTSVAAASLHAPLGSIIPHPQHPHPHHTLRRAPSLVPVPIGC